MMLAAGHPRRSTQLGRLQFDPAAPRAPRRYLHEPQRPVTRRRMTHSNEDGCLGCRHICTCGHKRGALLGEGAATQGATRERASSRAARLRRQRNCEQIVTYIPAFLLLLPFMPAGWRQTTRVTYQLRILLIRRVGQCPLFPLRTSAS